MNIALLRRGQVMPDGLPTSAQYISWRAVPNQRGGYNKVPCDAHGNAVAGGAFNRAIWCSVTEAWSRPWEVGFVLTSGCGYFLVDIDGCYDPTTEQWSLQAVEIAGKFPGAYQELSWSGRGLHILARGGNVLPEAHRTRRKGGGFELYTANRFFAIGTPLRGSGSAEIDHGPALLSFAMQQFGGELVSPSLEIEPGRDAAWAGPEDDTELLRVMLNQRPSALQGFGGGSATPAQIWHMDKDVLARCYPPDGPRADGLPFDHSAVDAALMAHLSYFTGRDQERMLRLFKQWPGYRREHLEARGERRLGLALRIGCQNPRVMSMTPAVAVASEQSGGGIGDYLAHLPTNTYYHRPTGQFFPAASIDNVFPKVQVGVDSGGMPKTIKASKWLCQNAGMHQATWIPGAPPVVDGFVMRDGVWQESPGIRVLNLYRPPMPPVGRTGDVSKWRDHIVRVYPDGAEHIFDWMAFVAQHPNVKVNHALVLGGAQGIGKDSMLAPLARAVGEWNWRETSPEVILTSPYNSYLMARVLRINEAKDTGGESRFQFYDKTKTIITAPPNVHSINEKHIKANQVPNLNATIITTNYRTGGLYLPADDRRHYVVFSDLTREAFGRQYWREFWDWMDAGGLEECAAWLMKRDVSRFDAKGPPTQTAAFWEMCEAGQSGESGDLADVVENLSVFTLAQLAIIADIEHRNADLATWIKDKRNAVSLNRSLNDLGFVPIRNPSSKNGKWFIGGKQSRIYVRQSFTNEQKLAAAATLLAR
jgi:hypothetical protein